MAYPEMLYRYGPQGSDRCARSKPNPNAPYSFSSTAHMQDRHGTCIRAAEPGYIQRRQDKPIGCFCGWASPCVMMAECGKFHTNVSEDRAASHGELGLEVALDFAHVLGSAGLPSNCDMALAKVSRDREVVLSASSTTNGVPDAPEVQGIAPYRSALI